MENPFQVTSHSNHDIALKERYFYIIGIIELSVPVRTKRCQDISSYAISTAAISTAAISTVHTFNRSHFQPHAISTAANSTASII